MQKEKTNNQSKLSRGGKEGYLIIPNSFLKKWIKVLGIGPALLYLELLTYCHKEKDIAWPTINSLCQQMGIVKTTLLRYQNTLIKFGLIKNITRGKFTTGHYKNNIYQITSMEELSDPDPGKIIDFLGSKMKPDRYQNDTYIGSNMKLSLVSNCYPNNNNINNTNTTTKEDVVVAVDFKKLKKEGDLSACGYAQIDAQAEERMRVTRERMVELGFKEEFMEKILKEYSPKKIGKKLDLLSEERNIHNPAGWLRAALKHDYRDEEEDSYPPPERRKKFNVIASDRRERGNLNSPIPSPQEGKGQGEEKIILSSEEVIRRFQLLRQKLRDMNQ